MVTLKINNVPVTVEEGTTILNAAAKAGVSIPTLCFLKDLNEIGACRVCVVEIKGKEKLVTACNNVVKEGMEILTNSPKVRNTRKINVELILSQHDAHCATCVRSRNCSLQNLANDLDIIDQRFQKDFVKATWPQKLPPDPRREQVYQMYALRTGMRQNSGYARLGRDQYGFSHDGGRIQRTHDKGDGLHALRTVHYALSDGSAPRERRYR